MANLEEAGSKTSLLENQYLSDDSEVEEEPIEDYIKTKEIALNEKQQLEAAQKKEQRAKAILTIQYLLQQTKICADFFNEQYKIFTDTLNDDPNTETQTSKEILENNKIDAINQYAHDLIYFEGGILRSYQIQGLNWLKLLFEYGVNGILADEMGLGKTVEVIALLCFLYEMNIIGPYLILAPLSTIPNWISEFKRFAPQIPVVLFHGSNRNILYPKFGNVHKLGNKKVFPVIITTYHIPLIETSIMRSFSWQYIIVDEGHRLKNPAGRLFNELKRLTSYNRLLLTGTPLQNNLIELWSLLNFLMPDVFTDINILSSLLLLEDMENTTDLLEQESKTNVILSIQTVLQPFVLRRLKADVLSDTVPKKEVQVYCPLTPLQKDLYKYVLNRDITKLFEAEEEEIDLSAPRIKRKCTDIAKNYKMPSLDEMLDAADIDEQSRELKKFFGEDQAPFVYRITMGSIMMMFRKIVNHPYLVHFPIKPCKKGEEKELLIDEDLIKKSGKMMVLDEMLPKLKTRGHKVLIFSTLCMTLDLIEEYLIMREFEYRRLDGGRSLEDRSENISSFNNNPDVFVFLLSTRAGGLGLNLVGADTVIFFDRDWNPQVDIQAQDRCHRIGQTKPVVIYTLVTKGTIDERVIKTGVMKRRLEKVVIKKNNFKKYELDLKQDLIKLLEAEDKETIIHSNGMLYSDEELEAFLDRTDLYEELALIKKCL